MVETSPVDEANGVLMWRYDVDTELASALLSHWADNTDLELSVVAEAVTAIIAGGDSLDAPSAEIVRAVVEQLRASDFEASTGSVVGSAAPADLP